MTTNLCYPYFVDALVLALSLRGRSKAFALQFQFFYEESRAHQEEGLLGKEKEGERREAIVFSNREPIGREEGGGRKA